MAAFIIHQLVSFVFAILVTIFPISRIFLSVTTIEVRGRSRDPTVRSESLVDWPTVFIMGVA